MIKILKQLNIPYAYSHFAEGESPNPPFICYLYPRSDNFSADGYVYFNKSRVNIELYTDKKDIKLERRLENLLTKNKIYFEKSEVYIQSEKLYEVVYELSINMEEEYEQ